MDMKKQPKSAAQRAKEYRDRKKAAKELANLPKPEPLTKERRIEILESKISDPDISPRDLKSLSRELSLLKGESIPYDRRPVAERKPIAPPPEPEKLPKWWSDAWAQTFLIERMAGIQSGWSGWQFTEELTRYWKELTPEEQQELRAKAQRLRETPRNATELGDSK
jgi:hypothetical protein